MSAKVKPIPEGYHTATPYLVIKDAAKAMDFYKEAFGAVEQMCLTDPEGKVMHAELRIGDSPIMLCDECPESGARGPKTIGGTSVSIVLYVEDADAVVNRAVAAGAELLMPVGDQFWGDRCGTVADPFGHKWTVATHKEDLSPDEISMRARKLFEMTERELVINRTFDVPRATVWKAWTDPERLMAWWGPKDFTSPSCTVDPRVGGKYLFCMRSPEGKDFWSTGTYRELVEPERIVCTDSFADEKGNVVPATHYGMNPDFPLELTITVTLEEQDGKTLMKLRHSGLPAGELSDMCRAGWNESFDKLAESLK